MAFSKIDWPPDVALFIQELAEKVSRVVDDSLVGIYIHGSLAMGGFHPNKSDVDVLAVTEKPMNTATKRELARLLLQMSDLPYPVEISFLNRAQLNNWQHPCPFDFHFSEQWRKRYSDDLSDDTSNFLNSDGQTDPDLAAHITVTNKRGVCVSGRPIHEVFPSVPPADYLSSIMGDYKDCLGNIEEDPVYCTLNMIRVYRYVLEGVVCSKQEAGNWALAAFPEELQNVIGEVVDSYSEGRAPSGMKREELMLLKRTIADRVDRQLSKRGNP